MLSTQEEADKYFNNRAYIRGLIQADIEKDERYLAYLIEALDAPKADPLWRKNNQLYADDLKRRIQEHYDLLEQYEDVE